MKYGFYGRLSSEFPSQLIVDVTEVCNLSCIHCPHPAFRKSAHYGGKFLEPELNAKLVDEVMAFGLGHTQYLRYTSNGEPLVHPEIYEMLEYACTHSGVTVALTTNAKMMREKQAERLLEVGVDLIDISIDAFRDDTYAKIRVGGHLPTTRANVQHLIRAKRGANSKTKVVVSYIEQPLNLGETKDFESFWKNEGADSVVVRKLHSAAGSKPDLAIELRKLNQEKTRKPCVYPWERMTLNAGGMLGFCPADWTHESSFVDFRSTTIRETWQGDFYRELREAHAKNDFRCHQFCAQCPDWSLINWPSEGRAYADMVEDFQRERDGVLA